MFWTLLAFSRKIIFRFSKRCSEAREQYFFWDFLGSHREKISRWKNLSVFQRLMFLYQLVNLVLETCLIFSKILKLGKTFLSWVFSSRSITRTTSVMIPLFQIFLEQKCSRKCEFLSTWGKIFYEVNCGVDLGFWHISFRKMFELLTCKRNHNSWVSGVKWRTLSWHGKSVRCYQTFLWVGFFALLLQLPRWSPCRESI